MSSRRERDVSSRRERDVSISRERERDVSVGCGTVQAAPAVLVVALLGEAAGLEQLMGGVPELGQRLGGAAIVPSQGGTLGGGGAAGARKRVG